MLVLSRQRKDTIHIGGDVIVYVLEIFADRVSLGVEAPRSVPIHRGEYYESLARHHATALKKGMGSEPNDL